MTRRKLPPFDRRGGCGGWFWHHRDYRPCRTCRLIGLHRAMEQVRRG